MLSDALAWSGEIYGVMSYKHSGGITLSAGSQHLIVSSETFQIHSIARRIAKPDMGLLCAHVVVLYVEKKECGRRRGHGCTRIQMF